MFNKRRKGKFGLRVSKITGVDNKELAKTTYSSLKILKRLGPPSDWNFKIV